MDTQINIKGKYALASKIIRGEDFRNNLNYLIISIFIKEKAGTLVSAFIVILIFIIKILIYIFYFYLF